MRDPDADAQRLEAALRPYFEEMLGARIVPAGAPIPPGAVAPVGAPLEELDDDLADWITFRAIMGD